MKMRKIAAAAVLGLILCLALSTGAFAKPAHNACGSCGCGCGSSVAIATSSAVIGGYGAGFGGGFGRGFGGGFGRGFFGFPFFGGFWW